MVTATKAGRYEIIDELGRGGMGVVYRAKDPSIGRIVAVKTIRLTEEGTGMSHAQLVERFQTEARAAGNLTHSNIVVIYDVGESDGLYYITMELVNGKTLQSLLDGGEKFPLFRVVRIMEQVCSALQFAHDHGVVHRDIKPANIMLTGEDFVKITDFGTAQILQCGAQQTSAVGTPGYMAPEQIKGKKVDGRTDIFSLGVVLYEMTTGRKPFRGQDIATTLYQILNEEPAAPQVLNPNLPAGVGSTIMKALSKSPHLRYENCRELLEDLKFYRPGDNSGKGDAIPGASAKVAGPPIREKLVREKVEKNFSAEMPRIPGVEPRPASVTPSGEQRIPAAANEAANNAHQEGGQGRGIYSGPSVKPDLSGNIKRLAKIGAWLVAGALVASWGVKIIGRMQADSDAGSAVRESGPSTQPTTTQPRTAGTGAKETALQNIEAALEIATLNELPQPWSSKGFVFQGSTHKYVPALIIRLPGAASSLNSYWAFSLQVPFTECQFEYVDNLAQLAAKYGYDATHAMVVNPCNGSVYDPLQHKELPGNVLVRGAVVHGRDWRPPMSIELKISGDHIRAVAME